jgi:YVTN family beta-propeller protein
MKKYRKIFVPGMIIIVILSLLIALDKWGWKHAIYMSGGVSHPPDCISCHVYPMQTGFLAKLLNEDYLSPLKVTGSADGKELFVTAQEGNFLLVIDPVGHKVIARIPVGKKPHSAVISPDGKIVYVSNQWSNTVSVVDISKLAVINTIQVGGGPSGMDTTPDGKTLFVANTYSNDFSIVDLATISEIKRLKAGSQPIAVKVTPDGSKVYITNRRTNLTPYRSEFQTEVTVADIKLEQVIERKMFVNAHLLENIVFTPSGDLALVTLMRPKNLVPASQLEGGWMMNHGIGIIETGGEGRIIQLLLDEPDSFYPDPFDIKISPDGTKVFVSNAGVDVVSVIDLAEIRKLIADATPEMIAGFADNLGLSARYIIKRIGTGQNPKGMAFSPDGKLLYVAERFTDKIAVIDPVKLAMVDSIDLGGPERITFIRKGQRLFYNAGRTFQNQYSCSSCHPDGGDDGLTYDMAAGGMGRNLTNTQSLRGIYGTSPYKWNGKNVSVYMQCGMRFSKFVTRTEIYSPVQLDQLVAFIFRGLQNSPNPYKDPTGNLTPAQERGKQIFERTRTNDGREIPPKGRCITCHSGPRLTNRKLEDVGTLSDTDNPSLFDTPELNYIYESPPYLHDGRANSLEEIWTKYGTTEKHGFVNDMTKQQLNDLISFLKSLGNPVDVEKIENETNNSSL